MAYYRLTLVFEVQDSRRSPVDTRPRARRAAEVAKGSLARARHVERVVEEQLSSMLQVDSLPLGDPDAAA